MRVVLRDRLPEWRLSFIASHLATEWEMVSRDEDASAYAAALADADALVSMSLRAGGPPMPKLKLLQLPGAGYERIDFSAVPQGATICNVFEHEIPIAEYLVLAMLEWQIRMGAMSSAMHQGHWSDGAAVGDPTHGELHGCTVGFIGYGHIAEQTARRLAPFGVNLRACTRSPEKHQGGETDGLVMVDGMIALDAMLADSDFVVVSCPLTEQTRGLIDAGRMALMKPTAVLLNVARGAVVDDAALYAACRTRRIGGAVVDVWTHYPSADTPAGQPVFPSDHPFQNLHNVVMTPHASGWTAALWARRWRAICANLDRLARGEALANVLRAPGGKALPG